ncbi:hypothetical protein [Pyrodictium abyssi]|uniref:Uncharacterized protein n=1 Tax=Pyrodictium abyssi TaxID=54256 RepID=A0ABM8ISB6_9CREN|nr:hypothetical protein PABY_00300 [Pyrodictium abyssi]
MRYSALAIAGILASAAALALLSGFATTKSLLNSFFATGIADVASEPIDVKNDLTNLTPAAGAQGHVDLGNITIYARKDVNITKLEIRVANAKQLAPLFDYFMVKFTTWDMKGTVSESDDVLLEEKGYATLWKPAVIILDHEDFNTDLNSDGNKDAKIKVEVFYEVREGMLFDNVPVLLNIKVLSTS